MHKKLLLEIQYNNNNKGLISLSIKRRTCFYGWTQVKNRVAFCPTAAQKITLYLAYLYNDVINVFVGYSYAWRFILHWTFWFLFHISDIHWLPTFTPH